MDVEPEALLSVFVSGLFSVFFSVFASEAVLVSVPATFFLDPDLKSVSYHPPPFNLNPAADTFLRNASCPHSGHVLSTGSLSF